MRRKVYSPKGTYLGVLEYPPEWDARLQTFGSIRIAKRSAPRVSDSTEQVPTTIASFTIYWHPMDKGSIVLNGISPEAFEQERGCAFYPSASYMRSLISEAPLD